MPTAPPTSPQPPCDPHVLCESGTSVADHACSYAVDWQHEDSIHLYARKHAGRSCSLRSHHMSIDVRQLTG